jgi:acetylornithine aminotransferase
VAGGDDEQLRHPAAGPGPRLGRRGLDDTGRRYLDLVGGIAVNSLGHAHPAVVRAVTEQISTLGHTSNLYITEPPLALAERLQELLDAPGARLLFCNSGTEANEAAFKMARRTGRPTIIAAENAFHGRTMGALALTGQPPKRTPFEPMTPGVVHIPYGDVAALEAAVDADTAAVFLEPIMGEAGAVTPPAGYLTAAREITAKAGALLVLDEVQTGIGRTGAWFAFQREGIVPDVVTLAKGLGGGLPIGACIGLGDAAALLEPGHHGTTFGGNPVCCAAALAVLDTIASDGLLDQVGQVGKELATGIEAMEHPLVTGVDGAGLLIGVMLGQRCPRPSPRPPGTPGSWSTTRCPTGSGWCRR